MRYHNIVLAAILKFYFWSIHTANNLILAISFGLKPNSNLNCIAFVVLFTMFTAKFSNIYFRKSFHKFAVIKAG